MKRLLFVAAMAALAISFGPLSDGRSAQNQGFTCDVRDKACHCNADIPWDCAAMAKNCKDGVVGSCIKIGNSTLCFCDMAGKAETGVSEKKRPAAVAQ